MEYIKDPDFQLEDTAVALGKFEGCLLYTSDAADD